jgi:hypothetical protein
MKKLIDTSISTMNETNGKISSSLSERSTPKLAFARSMLRPNLANTNASLKAATHPGGDRAAPGPIMAVP